MLKATDIAYGAIILSFMLTISMVVTKNRHAHKVETPATWDKKMLAKLPSIPSMRLKEAENESAFEARHVGLDLNEAESLPIKADVSHKVSLYAELMEREEGQIMVKCVADSSLAMVLKVHSTSGEEILEKSINAKPKAHTFKIISSRLIAGDYFLTLTDNDRIKVTEPFQISD
ncbi:MAG: hypothetical protein AAGC85_21270 [Bacteroidota bacterium]